MASLARQKFKALQQQQQTPKTVAVVKTPPAKKPRTRKRPEGISSLANKFESAEVKEARRKREGSALCPKYFPVGRARSAPSKTASELGLWPQSPVGIRAQRIHRQARRARKQARCHRDRRIVSRRKATRHDEPRDCFRVLTGGEWGPGPGCTGLRTADLRLLQR